MSAYLALLRGINVSGRNKIPMAELRSICSKLGWSNVGTYIQSGNVVFNGDGTPGELECSIEQAIKRHFSLSIPVIVRSAAEWSSYIRSNPFHEAVQIEPNRVMLALSRAVPEKNAVFGLQERAADGELIVQTGSALWIHFGSGAGRSRLSPGLLDRLVGSPVTMRNWNTVVKLDELLRAKSSVT